MPAVGKSPNGDLPEISKSLDESSLVEPMYNGRNSTERLDTSGISASPDNELQGSNLSEPVMKDPGHEEEQEEQRSLPRRVRLQAKRINIPSF